MVQVEEQVHILLHCEDIHEKYDVEVMAHLTCVSSTREHVESMVEQFKENGIENIMALRGDIPKDGQVEKTISMPVS